jgi:hypothetical protein
LSEYPGFLVIILLVKDIPALLLPDDVEGGVREVIDLIYKNHCVFV